MSHRNPGTTLLLGGSGFLGGYLAKALDRNDLIHSTNPESEHSSLLARFQSAMDLRKFLESQNFKSVINCIAMTDIDRCTSEPELAMWLNSEIPEVIAKHCKEKGIEFTHISTDAVFSGQNQYSLESDEPIPKSIYGLSKLKGEERALETYPKAKILRVNFFGWNNKGRSLFNFIYSNLNNGTQITGFKDVYFTPLYAGQTVNGIKRLHKMPDSGIFHVVGNERISKYDFCLKVAESFGFDSNLILPGLISDGVLGRHRNRDLSLSNEKIRKLGIEVPSLVDNINSLKTEMRTLHETK
jgi:dTDP-4-dehydrorhamnose reductase